VCFLILKEILMITSSGPWCDVCGKYILDNLDLTERVNCFNVTGIKETLCCDNACKKILESVGKDWRKLPDGPLKRIFQEAQDKLETPTK
jgi:hypothetical protein